MKRLLPPLSSANRVAVRGVDGSPLLDLDRVTVRFGGLVAVSELNLTVPTGSIVSVIGPNGAGKTTAFNTISGIYSPTSGSVRFEGRRLERSFTAGTFWAAIGIGLLTGLLFAAAAVDVDRLWLAVVKRGMVTGEPFTISGAATRLRGYFRAELAIDQMAGKWRVVSSDGSDVLAIKRDLAEARAVRNALEAEVTARRAGPGTVPDTTDLAGVVESAAGRPHVKEEVLDRLAAGKSRVRRRGWLGLIAGWILGTAGTIAVWNRGRRSPHVVARAGRRHGVQPLHPAGDLFQIAERHLDDLAEAECDDGEIVAAEAERRRTQGQTDAGRRQNAHDRRRQKPDLERIHRHRQDRQQVCPDAEECRDPEMNQARIAHHHVEPERQDAIDEERGHLPAQRAAKRRHEERRGRQHRKRDQVPPLADEIPPLRPLRQGIGNRLSAFGCGPRHTFSFVLRPSRPSGRNTRITIRIANTIAPAQRSPT